VLGDVGDPEPVRIIAVELTLHEIVGSGDMGHSAKPGTAAETLDAGSVHEHLDRTVTNRDAEAHGELGVDPSSPVGLA